jgi:hypothetical protein
VGDATMAHRMLRTTTAGLLTVALSAPVAADQRRDRQVDSRTDQTIQVTRGARLVVNNFAGDVIVRVWDRDAIRVQAEHSSRESLDIRTTDAQINVRTRSTSGPPTIDMSITAPTWMRLDLNGTYTDVTIEGSQGEINVETVSGDIRVRGGSGFVVLKSIQGLISLEGAKGRINVRSTNEGLKLSGLSGNVIAETTHGDLVMDRMRAESLDASTVNGEVSYEGTISNDGQYSIVSHNGDVTLAVPENTNATVAVRTYNGSFVPNFRVQTDPGDRGRNRRFNFVMGNGGARISLESFGGTIRLLRGPGRR